ncbi:MAG: tetratricopeptide repeat protein [Phycisphaeraceae bacterium]|nr:tetratricopeptide repeat protein [Phycisphaeraceae bacterium]
MDLGLPPFDPQKPTAPYVRSHCTDQYDARRMGHHALDEGLFETLEPEDTDGPGKEAYNRGVVAYERGDLDLAEQEFRSAVNDAPEAAAPRNNLAIVLFQRGSRDEAFAHFRRAAADEPGAANILRNLGLALWLSGRHRESIKALEMASEAEPDSAELHFLRSRVYDDMGDSERMIESMRRAVEAEPDNPAAHDNLGVVLQNTGRMPEAIKAFEHALSLDPDSPLVLYNLGQALYEADQNERAVEILSRHLALHPDHSCAHFDIARALSGLDRHDEALRHFTTYNELEPNDPRGVCSLGTELMLSGSLDQAEPLMRRALDLAPDFHWAVYCMGMLERARNRPELAAAFFREALRRDGSLLAARYALVGVILESQGHVAALDEVNSEANKADPGGWLHLLNAMRDNDLAEQALPIASTAVARFPDNGPIWGTYALLLDDNGRRDDALEALRRTTAINPDDLVAHFHAGRILAETSRFAQAIPPLEFVTNKDPAAVRPREYLIYCLGNTQQHDRAMHILGELLTIDPDNQFAGDLLGNLKKAEAEEQAAAQNGADPAAPPDSPDTPPEPMEQ